MNTRPRPMTSPSGRHHIEIIVPWWPILPGSAWRASCSGCEWTADGVFGDMINGARWNELHAVEIGVAPKHNPLVVVSAEELS